MILHNKKTRGILIAIGCAIIFGTWPPCVRAAYADGANPSSAILITTAARVLVLALFCLVTRKPLFATRMDTTMALRGGFFQFAAVATYIMAMVYLPGPVAITITFTHTLMLLFFLAWRGEVKLDGATLITTVMALVGLSFVLDLWNQTESLSLVGVGLAFASAICTMSRLYVFGKSTQSRNPAVVGAETFVVTMVFVLIMMLFMPPVMPASMAGYLWILGGSLSLAIGTFGMFYAIALIGSFRYSLLQKMEPTFTCIFSALLIGETLNWMQYAGIAAVIGSLAVYQYIDHRRKSV